MRARFLLLLLVVPTNAQDLFLSSRPRGADAWEKVRQALRKFPLIHKAMLTVGDASGELFNYAIGGITRGTMMQQYSTTKWISGVAILKEYERGAVDLDVPVSQYLKYWSTDPSDSRSNITLRHMLGFSDGYTVASDPKLAWLATSGKDLQGCARAIHDHARHKHAPGSIIDYNSEHLTLAGAVVEAAVGEPILDVIKRNVFKPAGMNSTHLDKFRHFQDLSSGLFSTPREFGNFVGALFRNELINETTRSHMFSDAFPSAKKVGEFAMLHSRYGLATWYECPRMFSPKPMEFSPECAAARIFACAGASGSYPIIDLHNKYYFHLAYNGPPGLGFASAGAFRDIVKPLVDAAVTGADSSDMPVEAPQERIACLEEARKKEWVNYTDGDVMLAGPILKCWE